MRKVKFRAWSIIDKEMMDAEDMKYGVFFSKKELQVIGQKDCFEFMQFTGLLDNKGLEIYENDIVFDNANVFVVKWESGGFVLTPIKYGKFEPFIGNLMVNSEVSKYINEECKVIGNIYEDKDIKW